MKIELFVLPEKTRADFMEAFVLTRDEFKTAHPDFVTRLERDGTDYDAWYSRAYIWDKMSPDLSVVTVKDALNLLRSREGTVLFISEPEISGNPGGLIHHGRQVHDYVAMADPQELADRIEYEWFEGHRLFLEDCYLTDAILPEDLYVFDTTLDWVIVFTHETDPDKDLTPESAETRLCLAFGL